METVISHSETWLAEVLFYPVVLPWFIEKFRSWNKVKKDKNKKVDLINTITNFSRISRGLFLWSIALFIEYPVHRRVNSTWQPKEQGRIPLFYQIWKYETEKLCFKCFHDFPLKCSKKEYIHCFCRRAPCK